MAQPVDPVAPVEAFANAWRRKRERADGAALRERRAERGRGGERRRDARYHLVSHAGRFERVDFLLRATEEHRIAALEPHDDVVFRGGIDEPLVDESLRRRMTAAALADRDPFGALRERERVGMDQRIVEDD